MHPFAIRKDPKEGMVDMEAIPLILLEGAA